MRRPVMGTGRDRFLPDVASMTGREILTRFEIAAPGPARLGLYSVDGRLVRRLVDATLEAGVHEAHWDRRDGAGRRCAPGIYFCKLETAGGRVTRRIMNLR